MVFQSYVLFPHLSVAQNILFGLSVRRVPRAEQAARLAWVAGMMDLEGAAFAQARAALGRSAARDAGQKADGASPLQSRTRCSPRLLWDERKGRSFSGSGMSCPELHLISRTKFLAADMIKK